MSINSESRTKEKTHQLILERISQYTGRQVINRLRFIGQTCPSIALIAYQLAIESIVKYTWDIPLYRDTLIGYNNLLLSLSSSTSNTTTTTTTNDINTTNTIENLTPILEDSSWIEKTQIEINHTFVKLENDVKYQATNLQKDTIRMSHLELARCYRKVGDLSNAHKAYSKARENSLTPYQIAEISLTCLDLAFDCENFKLATSQLTKAQAALETLLSTSSTGTSNSFEINKNNNNNISSSIDSSQPGEYDIKRWTERVDMVNGLTLLTQGQFFRAATSFLKVGQGFEDDNSGLELLATNSDIAIYTTLCALSTFDRSQLKEKIIDNVHFRSILESEPHLRTILNFFRQNQFRQVFEYLQESYLIYKTDIYLSDQIDILVQMIRQRAIVEYFSPFVTAKLNKATEVFGWSMEQMELRLVESIKVGNLKAKLDLANGVLVWYEKETRTGLIESVVESASRMELESKAALLRLKLISADLLVKDSNSSALVHEVLMNKLK